MTPEDAYQWLVQHSRETAYFISMGHVLGWDQRTQIPSMPTAIINLPCWPNGFTPGLPTPR